MCDTRWLSFSNSVSNLHKIMNSVLYLKSKLKSKSRNISTLGPWSKLKVEMILDSRNGRNDFIGQKVWGLADH